MGGSVFPVHRIAETIFYILSVRNQRQPSNVNLTLHIAETVIPADLWILKNQEADFLHDPS
jgi:hypothetical protein